MQFTTTALPIPAQLAIWQSKGLLIADAAKAESALSNINYFRFRAYAHTFQDHRQSGRPFILGVSLTDLLELYQRDKSLRLLFLDAIESIEVAFRAQLVQQFAPVHGPHWHENAALSVNRTHFQNNLAVMRNEPKRSSETFIQEYYRIYTRPAHPPSWMGLEVVSFGLLSKMFDNLKNSPEKKAIARHFGLTNHQVLESWMRTLCLVRNICAHHGRLWNRTLISRPVVPYNTLGGWVSAAPGQNDKLYIVLTLCSYLLGQIMPGNDWKVRLKILLSGFPQSQLSEMGFPLGWERDGFWG